MGCEEVELLAANGRLNQLALATNTSKLKSVVQFMTDLNLNHVFIMSLKVEKHQKQ